MKGRRGITLMETLVAGAIAALALTVACEGVVVATDLARGNAKKLAAEAFAWETAWTWLNRRYDDVQAGDYRTTISSNDCPAICRAQTGHDASLLVRVQGPVQITRHGQPVSAKRIDVDVAWGRSDRRISLNGLADSSAATRGIPVVVWKTDIERGQ